MNSTLLYSILYVRLAFFKNNLFHFNTRPMGQLAHLNNSYKFKKEFNKSNQSKWKYY